MANGVLLGILFMSTMCDKTKSRRNFLKCNNIPNRTPLDIVHFYLCYRRQQGVAETPRTIYFLANVNFFLFQQNFLICLATHRIFLKKNIVKKRVVAEVNPRGYKKTVILLILKFSWHENFVIPSPSTFNWQWIFWGKTWTPRLSHGAKNVMRVTYPSLIMSYLGWEFLSW